MRKGEKWRGRIGEGGEIEVGADGEGEGCDRRVVSPPGWHMQSALVTFSTQLFFSVKKTNGIMENIAVKVRSGEDGTC